MHDRPRRRTIRTAAGGWRGRRAVRALAALILLGCAALAAADPWHRPGSGGHAAPAVDSGADALPRPGTTPPRPPAVSAHGVAPPPAPGPWRLILREDFDGPALDGSRWVSCYDWNDGGCTNAGNAEEQWYLPSQVRVTEGQAVLTALRRTTRGSDGVDHPWTSGMLSTGRADWSGAPRFTFTYGYVEADIRMPREAGMFPAFWLMPAARRTPPEIDVVELFGPDEEAEMTIHWRDGRGRRRTSTSAFGPADWYTGFHRYGVEWAPDRVTWYIDGLPRFTVDDPRAIPHEPMEVVFTLAVGFPEPAPPEVGTASMAIDSVRVWQR